MKEEVKDIQVIFRDLPMLRKRTHYAAKSYSMNGIITDVDMNKRVVCGFFNSYNFMDDEREVVLPGAFDESIEKYGPNSTSTAKIKHLLNHDMTKVIGKLQVLESKTIDGVNGVYFESKMSRSQDGIDALINYQEEIYDNHSTGFIYEDVDVASKDAHGNSKMAENWKKMEDELVNPESIVDLDSDYYGKNFYLPPNTVLLVRKGNMFEGSTVAFGANTLTPYLGVKSGNKKSYELRLVEMIDKLEKSIKSGKQSDEMIATLSVQCRQLKQVTAELCGNLSTKKLKGVHNFVSKKQKENTPGNPKVINIAERFKL